MADNLNETIAETTESKVAPGIDSELDAALSKQFGSDKVESNKEESNEKPIEKAVQPAKEEAKQSKEQKDSNIREDNDKESLPDPEEIAENPPGKNSSQSKEGWNALRNNYKKAKSAIQEREEKIKKLETVIAEKGTTSTKEVEALKAKVEELSKYRATTDLQTDPEFITKFDGPIEERVASLKGILREWNISDDVISKIDFSNKNTLGAIAKAVRANQENITNEFSIEEFMTNARDVIELHKKKTLALEDHGKNYKQILEDKKKESFAKSAEDEGRTIKHLQEIAASKDKDGNFLIPFLNEMTPKENATPAEIADIDNHNKFVKSMYEKIDSEIKANDPERKAKLVVAAAASHYLAAQLKVVSAKLKSVEEELKKVSTVGSETEKSKIKAPARSNGKDLDLDAALSNFRAGR